MNKRLADVVVATYVGYVSNNNVRNDSFLRSWLPYRRKVQVASKSMLPREDNTLNKFIILKEGHIRMGKPVASGGTTTHPTIVPPDRGSNSRPPASIASINRLLAVPCTSLTPVDSQTHVTENLLMTEGETRSRSVIEHRDKFQVNS